MPKNSRSWGWRWRRRCRCWMATGSPLRWKSTIATRPFGGEEFHEDQHEKHAGQKTTAVGIKLYIFTIIYTHIYIYICSAWIEKISSTWIVLNNAAPRLDEKMPLLHSLQPQSIILVDFFKLCDPQRLVKLFFMDVYCMKQWQLSHTIFQFHFFGSSLWRNVCNMKEFMHWFLTLSFFKPYLYGYVCIYQLFLCLCVFLSLFTSSNSNKVRRQRDELQRSSASASTIGGRPESAGLWCDVTENLRLHQRNLT